MIKNWTERPWPAEAAISNKKRNLRKYSVVFFKHFYYLWCAVKDKCYADRPETIDALKDNIREAIDEIQLQTSDNVFKNWIDRVGYCMASRGSHLSEIIFHY